MPLIINQGDNLLPCPLGRLAAHLSARIMPEDNVADWLDYSLNRCGLIVVDEQSFTRTPDTETLSTRDHELVERLRRTETKHRVTMLGHVYDKVPVNPDGPEAADRLEALLSTRDDVLPVDETAYPDIGDAEFAAMKATVATRDDAPDARPDVEERAWTWLRDYSQRRHGEEPEDVSFSADQMVDAYLAAVADITPKAGR